MFEIDELKLYRGRDIPITDKIIVTQPTLGQIEEFGEKRYFNAVHNLTAVGADLKWQLWDYLKVDYTTIEDYDLFLELVSQLVSSKKKMYEELMSDEEKYADEIKKLGKDGLDELLVNPLSLILKDIDLADFVKCKSDKNDQPILYNPKKDITIDRFVYAKIVDTVRKIHGLKRNNQIPANERTKMDLIEDARDEARMAATKPYKSALKPLISAITVYCGQCGDENIWNMKIGMLFDNIKRASRIQESELLLQGAYSGFSSLKGVDKERLNWTGEI